MEEQSHILLVYPPFKRYKTKPTNRRHNGASFPALIVTVRQPTDVKILISERISFPDDCSRFKIVDGELLLSSSCLDFNVGSRDLRVSVSGLVVEDVPYPGKSKVFSPFLVAPGV